MGHTALDTRTTVTELLRVPARTGPPRPDRHPDTPGLDGGKAAGKEALSALGPQVSDLQERRFAEGVNGGSRNMLLVLQGMDTSGKGGSIRHSIGQLDPPGVDLASFEAELAAGGTAVVNRFLHLSRDEQLERLQARLDDPKQQWRFSPGDVEKERRRLVHGQ